MKHLLRLLKDSSLENNNQLYDSIVVLANYDTPWLTNDDMMFLTTSKFDNISLYKLFIHVENIKSVTDDEFFKEIDALILENFGDNELRELKITSMTNLHVVNSLIIALLTIPINTFTVNISKTKFSAEKSLENSLPISPLKMLLKNPTLLDANHAIHKSYRCEKKIDSIDIYVGPPVHYDNFTNLLCLLLKLPSNELWQSSHNNHGYKTQMIIVNDLRIINAELNDPKVSKIIESLMELQVLKIQDIKTAIDSALSALNHNQLYDENGFENAAEKFEMSNIPAELRTQIQHILLISYTFKSEKELSLKKLDSVMLAALNHELIDLEIDISYNPLSSLLNSSLPSDIEICKNLNRMTVKSILASYNNFQNNMPLMQLSTIACPLIYKQFIAIFPFCNGNIINIIKCDEVSELNCDGSYDVLSLCPHPTYNPSYISDTVIKKLELLISFLEFDGNYSNFENIINLIPFDVDDLPYIMTIMFSMTNIVYVTVCAAVYTYHMSIFKHYHVQSMYRLTCILGPDAYKLVLNNNINLPPIQERTSKLYLMSVDALFPAQLYLANVPLDEFDNTITNDNNVNKNKLNKHFSRTYPEYIVWLYLLSLTNAHKERDDDLIKRENYLLMMLRNTVENPHELHYIKQKLQHNVSELNTKFSAGKSYQMIDFDNNDIDVEETRATAEEITEEMTDRVNRQPEQHDVGIIYRHLINNKCNLQNDVWGLLYFMLRTKNVDDFIDCIKCYVDDL